MDVRSAAESLSLDPKIVPAKQEYQNFFPNAESKQSRRTIPRYIVSSN